MLAEVSLNREGATSRYTASGATTRDFRPGSMRERSPGQTAVDQGRAGRACLVRLEYAAVSNTYCRRNSTNPSPNGVRRGYLDRGPDGSSQDQGRQAVAAAAQIVFADGGAGPGRVRRQRRRGGVDRRSRRWRAGLGQCLAIARAGELRRTLPARALAGIPGPAILDAIARPGRKRS